MVSVAKRFQSTALSQLKVRATNISEQDRQPSETDFEWAIWKAYSKYLPDYTTDIDEVCAETGCSVQEFDFCSVKYSYPVRVKKQIAEALKTQITIARRDLAETYTRQRAIATALSNKLESYIDALDINMLSPGEALKLMDVAMRTEREASVGSLDILGELHRETIGELSAAEVTAKKQLAAAQDGRGESSNVAGSVLDILRQVGYIPAVEKESTQSEVEYAEVAS